MKMKYLIILILGLSIFLASDGKSEKKPDEINNSKISNQKRVSINPSTPANNKIKNRSHALGSGGNICSSKYFNAITSIGQPSPVGIDKSNDYINSSGFIATIKSANKIAGNAIYAITEKPVPKASVFLCGEFTTTALTNDSGYYEFIDLEQGQPYQIVPQKYGDFVEDSTISLTDARRVHLYLSGSLTFNHYEWLASDVNENGIVDYTDELLIIKRSLMNSNIDTVTNHCGQWRFFPNKYCYPALYGDSIAQNFSCVILGDNDGTWKLPSIKKLRMESISLGAWQDLVAYPDSILMVPISLEQGRKFLYAEIMLEYDIKILNFISCEKTELSNKFNLVSVIDSINGRIACALFSTDTVFIQGKLLDLQFHVLGSEGDLAELSLSKLSINGNCLFHGKTRIVVVSPKALPNHFELHQNYPNPCNSTTFIAYDLADNKINRTLLRIYNLKGQLVKTLVDKEQNAGFYRAVWDGTSESGDPVASGVYIYKITSGAFQKTKKLIILK